mgnify:CR=1 FL=1
MDQFILLNGETDMDTMEALLSDLKELDALRRGRQDSYFMGHEALPKRWKHKKHEPGSSKRKQIGIPYNSSCKSLENQVWRKSLGYGVDQYV